MPDDPILITLMALSGVLSVALVVFLVLLRRLNRDARHHPWRGEAATECLKK